LERAIGLGVEHLSAYALTPEVGTPLAAAIASGALPAPDDEVVADMYEATEDALAGSGFAHYEISNWARPVANGAASFGEEPGLDQVPDEATLLTCQHNLIYWRNEPYLGIGAGAHSYVGGKRFARTTDPLAYVRASPFARASFSETIGTPLEMAETAILALRLATGLSRARFGARFGVDPVTLYGTAITSTERLGLLEMRGDRVRLTRRGRLLSNEVFQLLLPG
jgi:oxygen-independent coproporphyrinogen III oxidase